MTTILRSSKYIRCLNALTRRIIIANDNNTILRKSLELQAKCANSCSTKSYATIPAIKRTNDNAPSYDKTFAKLDECIQRYGRLLKPEVEIVLSHVRETGYISSLDALLLIRCCGNLLVDILPNERNKLVGEIWSTLCLLKIPLDVSHFNALLRVYLENNYDFLPVQLLTMMKDKAVEPNRITYQRLMLHHCKKGNIEGATTILEIMREKGIPLSEGVFSALIIGHSAVNDMESAKNILDVMKEAGVTPSSGTYTALLCAYASRGDMASIRTTLEEFGTKNLFLQDNDYFEVIHTLAAEDHTEKIDEILPMMPKGPNYNVDAAHAILKILDVGNSDAAMKILPTMRKRRRPDGDENMENENGSFLIKKLVHANFPDEQIVAACEHLYHKNENKRAFLIALARSLWMGNAKLSYALMEALVNKGGEIREHYFRPLLVANGKASNYQGMIDVVRTMITKFDLMPTLETLRDYILPHTVGQWDDIISSLKELRLSHEKIVSSIACRMLLDDKIRKSASFMLNYPAKHYAEFFYQPLVDAVKRTGDTRSFAVIVRLLCEHGEKTEKTADSTTPSVPDMAMTYLLQFVPGKHSLLETIIEHMVEMGLTLSPETGNAIREYLTDNMNPPTDERIEKLTSGTLTPKPISELSAFTDLDNIREMHNDESRSIFTGQRRALGTAFEENDLEAVKTITENLLQQNFTFSPALYAQIIEIYCNAEDIENADKWLKRCQSQIPDCSIDLQKTTKYASLLIKKDRFDDAIQFIRNHARVHSPESHSYNLKSLSKSLLDVAASTGDVEKTNKLFDALVENKFITVDNYMLGPLIRVHLNRDDNEGALNAFEKACQNHHCTPLKGELSKKLIDAEDAQSLQRLTDLSTEVHGENNSLIDLVAAFIECGRLRQARKILETPELRLRERKLRTIVDRYSTDDTNNYLNQWTTLTKGLPITNRQEYFDTVMESLSGKDNWQGAMDLWMSIQEEDVQPSDKFLKCLADVLKRNGQPIPFACDSLEDVDSAAPSNKSLALTDFYQELDNSNLEQAHSILNGVTPQHPEFTSAMSALIVAYLKDRNDLKKAAELAEETLLKYRRIPRANALKAVWNGFIDNGEFDQFRRHSEIFDMADKSNIKKRWRFEKFVARADMKELGVVKFLTEVEKVLNVPNCDKKEVLRWKLHFSTLIAEMDKDPTVVAPFTKFADNLAKEGIILPANLLWCYHFVQNRPEADEVWSKYLANSGHVLFKYIVTVVNEKNDVALAERLFEKINSNTAVPETAKSYVFVTLIDLYTKNGQTAQALELLNKQPPSIVKRWCQAYQMSVKKLQNSAQSSGLPFNIDVREYRQSVAAAE